MLFLLLACGEPAPEVSVEPITNEEASKAASVVFCDAAVLGGMSCAAGAGVVILDGRSVETSVTVSGFVPLAPRKLGVGAQAQLIPGEIQLAANVSVSVDGQAVLSQDFTHAASNTDLEIARAEVLDEVLQRWMVGTGLALLDALHGEGAPGLSALGMEVEPAPLAAGTVYAAYPMLSGVGLDPSTGAKMGPNVGSMAKALGPYLEGVGPGLHVVHIETTLGGAGGPGPCGILPPVMPMNGGSVNMVRLEGSVTVDDGEPQDVCGLSGPVSWPLPPKGNQVTWEQFFVVSAAVAAE
jgi:hypothetical protein